MPTNEKKGLIFKRQSIYIRPDLNLIIYVPDNLNQKEADYLAKWIKETPNRLKEEESKPP